MDVEGGELVHEIVSSSPRVMTRGSPARAKKPSNPQMPRCGRSSALVATAYKLCCVFRSHEITAAGSQAAMST